MSLWCTVYVSQPRELGFYSVYLVARQKVLELTQVRTAG